ncbi:MAG: AsmA family protein [Candidatus Omnitrophica bacterium]|nr:AsmA family protein [Candidatus Omnitrophota bacterium]MDE2009002.1 AsmA family protein [Candidatus Omnitrophota bacterium]MDE2214526.1 AsmA family protein [Candidatus Omnitrophota bacterium]MDE2230844.1 AsmA family protein [Candidatus Omnitrophota bacterium]
MKIIRTILVSLLALMLVAATVLFIFFQTFDADQYFPRMAPKASRALGRTVVLGHMGLGLSLRGITVDAGPVTVADDPGFTTQPFIEVKRVRIGLNWWALIARRKIQITTILLQSPQIHFIINEQGDVNVHSFAQNGVLSGGEEWMLRSARYRHKGQPIGESPLKRAFGLPSRPKEHLNIHSEPSPAASPISIEIRDASISLIDQNPYVPLDIWLEGVDADVKGFSFSAPFVLSFGGCFYRNAPNVHARAQMYFDALRKTFNITNLQLAADLSRLQADRLDGISPGTPGTAVLKNITGKLGLDMGHLDFSPTAGVYADGHITVTDGVLKGFNIIKFLFSRFLGNFIGGNIEALFKRQSQLTAPDTVIQRAVVQFSYRRGTLFIDDFLAQTNIFELNAKGLLMPGWNADMQTVLHLDRNVSEGLIGEFHGLKRLEDTSQRVVINASLKGTIPHLKYKPDKDFRKESRKALMEEGGNILGALLGARGL